MVFKLWCSVFVGAFVILGVSSNDLDFIIKCKLSDRACTTRSGQAAWPVVANGIPSLGIAPSDPLLLKVIKSNQGGLNLEFTNLVAKGLKNCKVLDFQISDKAKTFNFDVSCKFVTTGKYNISGRVLVLPVVGEGDFRIDLENLQIHMEGAIDQKFDGYNYWNVLNFRQNSTALAPVIFKFDNLFNGSKQLSDPVHDFANNNYRDVLAELGGPIIEALCKKVMKAANKLLKLLPTDVYILQ